MTEIKKKEFPDQFAFDEVRRIAKRKGMNMDELSLALNIGYSRLSTWGRARRVPRKDWEEFLERASKLPDAPAEPVSKAEPAQEAG